MKSYKAHFQKFISADPKRIHFAAHSHHFWPDVTFDAHMKAWTDAATLADDKWDRFFGKLWPRAQRHVARVLRLPDPSTIAFAPNTHELVMRVVSSMPLFKWGPKKKQPLSVLTTDGEFHSFARQLSRFEEEGLVKVARVPTEPFDTFPRRFAAAARKDIFDLVYVSQVFFDSGFAFRDLSWLMELPLTEAAMIVDGYHAFCAIDVDLSQIANRIFYVGGGYKYAMSGEGCCFLHAPAGRFPRPVDTGWFAAFFAMQQKQEGVLYAEDASRFLGATFDPTGLYRFDAAMTLLEREGITTKEIDARAKTLQSMFGSELAKHTDLPLRLEDLVVPLEETNRGQFLVFKTPAAKQIHEALAARGVMTDVRGDRLRFGFAIYHDETDVVEGVRRIAEALI